VSTYQYDIGWTYTINSDTLRCLLNVFTAKLRLLQYSNTIFTKLLLWDNSGLKWYLIYCYARIVAAWNLISKLWKVFLSGFQPCTNVFPIYPFIIMIASRICSIHLNAKIIISSRYLSISVCTRTAVLVSHCIPVMYRCTVYHWSRTTPRSGKKHNLLYHTIAVCAVFDPRGD